MFLTVLTNVDVITVRVRASRIFGLEVVLKNNPLSIARRTKAERSEAHGGVYPSWVGARVGGGSCGGQLLPWFTLASRGHCRLVGNT